ncbi:MAG: hypothetical protein JST50_20815 [Bacteroidetes bacterium]|jgi:hypothetical protein|nr:hypothetical protein [Bacteroidota bacterium]
MATDKLKIIRPGKTEAKHTHRDNWEVMKPFVIFSFKALKMIGSGLIAIINALPTLKPHTDNTVIKRR